MQAALSLNQQIDNHGRSMGACSFAAGCRGYRPAGRTPHRQDTRRKPGGFLLNDGSSLTRGFIVVPPKTRPGLRARPLSRGWFGHPDDIAQFRTRAAAGLTAEQVAALLHFNPGHHVLADFSDGPESHSSVPSAAHVLDDRESDRKGIPSVQISFASGARSV